MPSSTSVKISPRNFIAGAHFMYGLRLHKFLSSANNYAVDSRGSAVLDDLFFNEKLVNSN